MQPSPSHLLAISCNAVLLLLGVTLAIANGWLLMYVSIVGFAVVVVVVSFNAVLCFGACCLPLPSPTVDCCYLIFIVVRVFSFAVGYCRCCRLYCIALRMVSATVDDAKPPPYGKIVDEIFWLQGSVLYTGSPTIHRRYLLKCLATSYWSVLGVVLFFMWIDKTLFLSTVLSLFEWFRPTCMVMEMEGKKLVTIGFRFEYQ